MSHLIVLVHGMTEVLRNIPSAIGAGLRTGARTLARNDRGQAVTEYTLVILVAATVALLLLNWVNGGAVAGFFDTIFNQVTGMFTS